MAQVPATEDLHSVADWISGWGAEVTRVDFVSARTRFDPDVIAFGTHADVVVGIDQVEAGQWSQVWPRIEDFQFLVGLMKVVLSPDRLVATAAVPWDST